MNPGGIDYFKRELKAWPTAVAAPVQEYFASADVIEELRPMLATSPNLLDRQRPFFLGAHRLCDAAEMITRFFACIALSDLAARGPESFGNKLRSDLTKALAQPSFGVWASLGGSAYRILLNKYDGGFAPPCAEFWQKWKSFLGSDARGAHPSEGIIAFRNDLHHRGRISETEAQHLHDIHQALFLAELSGLNSMAGLQVVAVSADGEVPRLLHGASATSPGFTIYEAAHGTLLKPGHTYLLKGTEALEIFPLHHFAPATTAIPAPQADPAAVPMLYFRYSENQRLVSFTTLVQADSVSLHGGEVSEAFVRWFPLDQWRDESLEKGRSQQWEKHRYDFADIIRSLSTEMVGREDAVAETLAWQKTHSHEGGLLWIGGEPGIGKSALTAELVRRWQSDATLSVVPFFFRSGDARCHPDRFYEAATFALQRRLKSRLGSADETPESLFLKTLDQFTKARDASPHTMVFVLDGLDEVVGVNADFIAAPLKLCRPGVVWICLGRNQDHRLAPLKDAPDVARLQGGDLGRFNEAQVREYLDRHCGPFRYALYQRDEATGNAYLKTIFTRSQGLPLYLHLVVEDILAGRHTFNEERNLPAGLGDYYAKMIRDADAGIGTGSLLITNLAAQLCWAREPLSEETLVTLLDLMMPNSRQLREKVSAFLRIGHVLLRRAPDATGAPGYGLYHDAVRNYLRDSDEMEMPCDQALFMLLEWCSRWREHQTHYALRHYPSHLRQAGRIEELYTLARDQEFLDAQASSFYDEPRVPLETLHLALDVAIERQNLPEIIEFCYACARLRGSIVRESPLGEICDSISEADSAENRARHMDSAELRARDLIGQLADVNDQFIWWLILAVEYVDRREYARAVALIRTIPTEHFHGRFDPDHQRCALVLFVQLADLRGIESQRRRLLQRLNADHQRRLCILLAKCGNLDAAAEVLEQIRVEDEARIARREFIKALAAIGNFPAAWGEIDRLPHMGPKAEFERGWAAVDMVQAFADRGNFEAAWQIADRFAPGEAWQRARALQFIARSQLIRFGKQSDYLQTLSESRRIIEGLDEGTGRDRRQKARALAELAGMQARLDMQSTAVRTFRAALDIALALPADGYQLKLLTGLLWNLDAAAREKPRFADLFQQTVEDLLGEERRWRNYPNERSEFAKLIATLQAEQGRFAEAFRTAGTIRQPDVHADALGRIADGLQRAGERVEELLRRLPVRNRLLVAAQIGEGLIAEGRPREVRFLIAEQLVTLASLQSAHVWGRPLLRGSLAAAFFRVQDPERGRELFREAEAMVDRLSIRRSHKPKAFATCDLAMNLALAGETGEAIRVFAKAKELSSRGPLDLAQICAREAEVGLHETAGEALTELVARAHQVGAKRPERAVKIFGEIAVSFVRLKRFDRAEEAIKALLALLPRIVELRSRAEAAAEAAVQIAKAGTKEGRCYAWAETLVQATRDICRDTEYSAKPVREPGQVWRVEAILLGAVGKLAEAAAKARRNSHTEHQTRSLRDIAELCLHFEQPARAFEVCLMIQHDRSKMLPDMIRHFLKHGNLQFTFRLLGYATDYLDGAYRLICQILRHAPASPEDLQKILAWLNGFTPKVQP